MRLGIKAMIGKRFYWTFAIVALIAFLCWQFGRHQPAPLISGKPVAYWLENLPPATHDALLPGDFPLALAGPEIISPLTDAIEKSYAVRDFINRHRGRFPPFLERYLPKQGSPGYESVRARPFAWGYSDRLPRMLFQHL